MRFKQFIAIICLLTATAGFAHSLKSDDDISEIVNQLTLEQKARLLVGTVGVNDESSHIVAGAAGWTYPVKKLGIPSINLADGPVGLRINPVSTETARTEYDANGLPVAGTSATENQGKPNYCTCFPATTALAATWNKSLAYLQGEVMGKEAKSYGVDVVLTPGINIIRNPLCGRNFEYYSEDPFLSGKMASELIKGIQQQGIGTSLKHFVANNQQTGKKYNDARISQRALREIYLKGFEICVKESHPWTIMGSYNKIAGEFTQTNRQLLIDLLRDEWKFDGMVLTDWTVRRPIAGLINARCALNMPGEEDIVEGIIKAVKNGEVTGDALNDCVHDVLRVVLNSVTAHGWQYSAPDLTANARASQDVAEESMVLLKNDEMLLPISTNSGIALYGTSAYQSIAGGTGSSNVNKAYIVDISTGLEHGGYRIDQKLKDIYTGYNASQNKLLDTNADIPDWQRISYHRHVIPEMDLAKGDYTIQQSARSNDLAVIVIGRGSGETSDRQLEDDLNLSGAEKTMIEKVSRAFHAQNKKVVVVLNICGVIETASWRDMADAILIAWLPGQECGHAVSAVLSGQTNPSGRLPVTFPVHYVDIPSSKNYPCLGQVSGRNFDYTEYQEDIWVGYRYFSTSKVPVAYPFGFGLSYTTFDYSNAKIRKVRDGYEISVDVTNSGACSGKEVVQIYVSAPDGDMIHPEVELKTFGKTNLLKPNETQTVRLKFTDYDIASFDEINSQWLLDEGTYKVVIGRASDDAIITRSFNIKKPQVWKVRNLLAPVEPVNKLTF